MEPYLITERDEYQYCIQRGFQPLLDIRNFTMEINLRVQIQRELFGERQVYKTDFMGQVTDETILQRRNILVANERFFRWIWEHKTHQCEETMRPLRNYSAVYCSHILTRGAHPEMAHDPRNINILTFECHNQWETGKRDVMRIYPGNLRTIELLQNDYKQLSI